MPPKRRAQCIEYTRNTRDKLRYLSLYLIYIFLTLDPNGEVITCTNTSTNRSIYGDVANISVRFIRSGEREIYCKQNRYALRYVERRDRRGRIRYTKVVSIDQNGPVVIGTGDTRIGETSERAKLIIVLISWINHRLCELKFPVRYIYSTRSQTPTHRAPLINNLQMVCGSRIKKLKYRDIIRIGSHMNDILCSFLHVEPERIVYISITDSETETRRRGNVSKVWINGKALVALIKGYRMK